MTDSPRPAGDASAHTATRAAARTRTPGARTRHRVSVVGVIGELLVTAGVVVMLFVVWQLWIGDMIGAARNTAEARSLAEEWSAAPPPAVPAEPAPAETAAPAEPLAVDPVVAAEPADGEEFAIMHIPRFGDDYQVRIGGGVSRSRTLDTIGIGHYPGTQMPGEVGNFAVAAHRTGYGGAPFYRIAELRVGDPIIVETQDGWYTYIFRTLEYVRPSAVEVLNAVPHDTVTGAGERYLTMTSCSPKHTIMERIIGYSVFDSFTPRAAGAPAALGAGSAS